MEPSVQCKIASHFRSWQPSLLAAPLTPATTLLHHHRQQEEGPILFQIIPIQKCNSSVQNSPNCALFLLLCTCAVHRMITYVADQLDIKIVRLSFLSIFRVLWKHADSVFWHQWCYSNCISTAFQPLLLHCGGQSCRVQCKGVLRSSISQSVESKLIREDPF